MSKIIMKSQQKGRKRQTTKVEIGWRKHPSKRVKRETDNGWGEPAPIKEIKHEGFGGNLNPNPNWQWLKGTVMHPHYETMNMEKEYGIPKKKKTPYWLQENPWKKHHDRLDMDSDDESYEDAKYHHNEYMEWIQQSKKLYVQRHH